ncbi:MBL fold metallo-hydrolase [Paenibacillus sp. GCM10027626]|uniref:MBL fold metallo-hydrolase n=1 Tax=Paenibacillus sp. GCM10027626 TaxID=3273411 RepID=UPI0036374EEA
MNFQIQMLGTGSAFAKKYFNNNALFFKNEKIAMLDCGITAPWALHQLGYTFNDIDALFISHIHADHIGGVEEFAFQRKFVYNRLPALFIPEPLIEPLWEHSLKGGLWQEDTPALEDYFRITPLYERQEIEIVPGLTVEAIRTKHINGKASFSYLINKHFFYSADIRFTPELLQSLCDRGCQTIFHDCQLTSPAAVHTSLDELLTLPTEIQQRIWLMHYGDAMPEFEGRTGPMRFVKQHIKYDF